MKNLALNVANRPVLRLPVECARPDDDISALTDRLVSRLWLTYCEMGRIRPH